MNPILHFAIVLSACALLIYGFIKLVTWFGNWLDRAENAASNFQRDVPYIEPPAPYTARTETADDFLRGDFGQAGFNRLRAEVDQARTETADPTSPANLRHIPAPRQEQP